MLKSYDILQCKIDDTRYPRELAKLSKKPSIIYYRGNIEIINQRKNIAVIGSRKSSSLGNEMSYETGVELSKLGINIVNGLALGCDTNVIKGALSVGGKCIAIMPCGLEQIVPKSNLQVAEEILDLGGCIISEYPSGTPVQRYQYVERDKIQSGISQGVIVIEAERDSGTMHTATFALQQQKRLACYYHKLLEKASGNEFLQSKKEVSIINNYVDLADFTEQIKNEKNYEQMSILNFL